MDNIISVHISDRTHLNITLNIYHCGNGIIDVEQIRRQDYYTFYYVLEGSGSVTQCEVNHALQAGQCFLSFPNESSMIKAKYGSHIQVLWISFSGYLVDQYVSRAKLSPYEPIVQDDAVGSLRGMFLQLVEAATKPANRYCPMMSQLYGIFAYLLDNIPKELKPEAAPAAMYVMKALDFIDIYYQDAISVEDIASSVGLNRKSLYMIFKRITGFSTKDYLIYYRMNRATALLATTNLLVESIALSVGYRDQFHFSKEFKKNVGCSPTEYRKMILEDPSKKYTSPIDLNRIGRFMSGNTDKPADTE